MRARVVAIMEALVVLATACSTSAKTATPSAFRTVVDLRAKAAGEYPEARVVVKDNEFVAPAIRVNPGTTVHWVNQGRGPHDILPADAAQDFGGPFGVSGDKFVPGAAYEFRFDTPGVYRYYCSLHGSKT